MKPLYFLALALFIMSFLALALQTGWWWCFLIAGILMVIIHQGTSELNNAPEIPENR